MPGRQNIGPLCLPPAAVPFAPTEAEVAPDGSFAAISGMGGLGRLDLDPSNPLFWSYAPINSLSSIAVSSGEWACAVSPESSQIAAFNGGMLRIYNANGTIFNTVPLPDAASVYTITGVNSTRWRSGGRVVS